MDPNGIFSDYDRPGLLYFSEPLGTHMYEIDTSRFCRRHFQNDFFVNENRHVLIQISLKYVPSGATDNKPAMIQIMTWAPSQYKDRLIYVWRFPC